MPLKILQPIVFEPIWAEYENWGWERQDDWASNNGRSDNRRRRYIEEQFEIADEVRRAKIQAKANRAEIEGVIMEMVAAGVICGGK